MRQRLALFCNKGVFFTGPRGRRGGGVEGLGGSLGGAGRTGDHLDLEFSTRGGKTGGSGRVGDVGYVYWRQRVRLWKRFLKKVVNGYLGRFGMTGAEKRWPVPDR